MLHNLDNRLQLIATYNEHQAKKFFTFWVEIGRPSVKYIRPKQSGNLRVTESDIRRTLCSILETDMRVQIGLQSMMRRHITLLAHLPSKHSHIILLDMRHGTK